MITLRGIEKSYSLGSNKLMVLKGLNMQIYTGEMVSIMGPSGSGKSTLLNILGMLDNYDSGEYMLDNVLIKDLSEKQAAQYRNKFLGFVFQSFNLLPFKSAVDNVALPLYYQKVGKKQRTKRAEALLEKAGLLEWRDHLPTEMSGGQKQRVAIARALVTEPKVVLADEPTGALDTKTSSEIIKIFKDVNASGVTIVIVTHDPEVAKATQRLIKLRDGIIEN
ncbi:MAG: ABC transporter ATP-binding protein [Bacteroidetes bacterium]|nr:ABC transporter ATP-binding protein [Bacteroidota bacterium]